MRWFRSTLASLTVVLSFASAAAETIVIAIEDKNWSPYYTWVDGKPQGPCPEIAVGAIGHMGGKVEFERVPWVRVVQSVERQKVDAGLCGTKTEEREAFSHFPDEPLLNYDATLFVRTDSALQDSAMPGLAGKSFGLIKGYTYGGVDNDLEANGMVRIDTPNRESLLKLLVLGRVDMVLDSFLPVTFDAQRLGVKDQVRAILPSIAVTPGYLFFSKKPGHDQLAERFSQALKKFKATSDYLEIKEKYGL